MQNLKKLLVFTLLLQGVVVAGDNRDEERRRQAEIKKAQDAALLYCAGLAVLGSAGAIVYYISDSDELVLEKTDAQLDMLAKYQQIFDFTRKSGERETQLESHLEKLGMKISDIDTEFLENFNNDYAILDAVAWTLWSRSFASSHMIPAHNQTKQYLSNVSNLAYVQGHQLLNFYDTMPAEQEKISTWARSKAADNEAYPLSLYKVKTEKDIAWIHNLKPIDLVWYPKLTTQLVNRKAAIVASFTTLRGTKDYQDEFNKKADDEYKARLLQAQEEIARAEREKARAQTRMAAAQEVNNQSKRYR